MAKRFGIVHPADDAFSYKRAVASGAAASIDRGAPTKEDTTEVAIMADGEGTTSQQFSGLAKSVSTDTAATAGTVELYLPLAGLIYVGSPKVAAAANTEAEILALCGKRIVFDLTTGDWTVDSAAVDDIGNAVVIVGGNPADDVVYFVVTHTTLNFFENN
jgi:hypothetical protein